MWSTKEDRTQAERRWKESGCKAEPDFKIYVPAKE